MNLGMYTEIEGMDFENLNMDYYFFKKINSNFFLRCNVNSNFVEGDNCVF